ncbi:unnamed protein product [Bursaphelenchus xylophilus]|uniref:(pine wood nematode) hypothetical protein n=1 Tax=Bursaphelenchus xylophilus TaxID=6326 RepID=A0A1I7S7V7_BURXY|nr:unnamed protein product [Bursaphelenchus xylophilus]CAG9087107.1 unnamed protein product [Bursaphelenchus xylophilus]
MSPQFGAEESADTPFSSASNFFECLHTPCCLVEFVEEKAPLGELERPAIPLKMSQPPRLNRASREWTMRWCSTHFLMPKQKICIVSNSFLGTMRLSGNFDLFISPLRVSSDHIFTTFSISEASLITALLRVRRHITLDIWLAAAAQFSVVKKAVTMLKSLPYLKTISLSFFFPGGRRVAFDYFVHSLQRKIARMNTSWTLAKRLPERLDLSEFEGHVAEYLTDSPPSRQNYTQIFAINVQKLAINGRLDFRDVHFERFIPNTTVLEFRYMGNRCTPFHLIRAFPCFKMLFPRMRQASFEVEVEFPLCESVDHFVMLLKSFIRNLDDLKAICNSNSVKLKLLKAGLISQVRVAPPVNPNWYESVLEVIQMKGATLLDSGTSYTVTEPHQYSASVRGRYINIVYDNGDEMEKRTIRMTIWQLPSFVSRGNATC